MTRLNLTIVSSNVDLSFRHKFLHSFLLLNNYKKKIKNNIAFIFNAIVAIAPCDQHTIFTPCAVLISKNNSAMRFTGSCFIIFIYLFLFVQGKWKGSCGIIDRTKSWCGTSEPIIIRSSTRYKSDIMTKWASLPER